MSAKILLIDDDKQFTAAFQFAFDSTFRLKVINSFAEAIPTIKNEKFDLIFADHHLGNHSGLEVVRLIRQSDGPNRSTPVLVVTALPDIEMTIEYLNSDVQGFITKPINFSVIAEKIQSTLEKYQHPISIEQMDYSWIKVDFQIREVNFDTNKVTLTPTELSILEIFLKNPGKAIPREEICERIWGTRSVSKNTFDTHLLNLRKKVPPLNQRLHSVYGSGYILN